MNPNDPKAGVLNYAEKREMLRRVRDFMFAHIRTLSPERQAEAMPEARRFSRFAEDIEEDLSRLDQKLRMEVRQIAALAALKNRGKPGPKAVAR